MSEGGSITVYCIRCGAQNVEGARFCSYCAAPLDLTTTPAGAAAPPSQPPAQPPYAPTYPPPQWVRPRRAEEECMGQTRIPGLVIFALIILLIGVFALIQWLVQQTYGSTATGLVWPVFGIALGLLIIGVWALMRPPMRR